MLQAQQWKAGGVRKIALRLDWQRREKRSHNRRERAILGL
jgi:hypothetical protein